jgi:uncharacterized membrane protein
MIDAHHVHLMLSHLPVVGVLVGIALLAWGFVARSMDVKKASLGLFIACALAAVVTVATGESAEERVESLVGIRESSIERHEEAGKTAALATYILGGGSLVGLLVIWRFRRASQWVFVGVILLALATAVVLMRAANIGGTIRHPEIGSLPSSKFMYADSAHWSEHDQR